MKEYCEKIKSKLSAERKNVDTSPTEAQIEAGNYAKGHISIQGYQITIENPKGSYRHGVDKNGKEWKTKMHNDYGYFTRTLGKDGDAIDVFIGNSIDSDTVFVVDQKNGKGEFDESKVMLGFKTAEDAKKAYLSNYSSDWKGFMKITGVSHETFKKWLYDGHRQRKPFYQYVEVQKQKLDETKKKRKLYLTESQFKNICLQLNNFTKQL